MKLYFDELTESQKKDLKTIYDIVRGRRKTLKAVAKYIGRGEKQAAEWLRELKISKSFNKENRKGYIKDHQRKSGKTTKLKSSVSKKEHKTKSEPKEKVVIEYSQRNDKGQLVFKRLTEYEIGVINGIHKDDTIRYEKKIEKIELFTGRKFRSVRKWLSQLGLTHHDTAEQPEQYEIAKQRKLNDKKYYLVTWAQSCMDVDRSMIGNMEVYADFLGADIHVIAGRYKAPTSLRRTAALKKTEWWDEKINMYLDAARHNIHPYMTLMSDVKMQPTAVWPLDAMESMSKGASCIFGHPKIQSKTIPVLDGEIEKIMLTTGSCTRSHYTDTKAGKKGEFYHELGFVIVEIEDDQTFHVRQVTCEDDGSFSDLFFRVKDNKVSRIKSIDTLNMGDIHYGEHEQAVLDITFGDFCQKLIVKNLVLEDIFDGYSISHHERNNPFVQFKNEMEGRNDLKKEVEQLMVWLGEVNEMAFENIIVTQANHNDFLDRWLISETNWAKHTTPKNALTYMKYAQAIMEGEADNGIIAYEINKRYPNIITLGRDESYKSLDWELSIHGDVGMNGAKGTIKGFTKLNTKMIIAHSHSPSRLNGVLQVGTSTKKRLSYNIGASSWWWTHAIVHETGEAQLINFVLNKSGEISYTTLS